MQLLRIPKQEKGANKSLLFLFMAHQIADCYPQK